MTDQSNRDVLTRRLVTGIRPISINQCMDFDAAEAGASTARSDIALMLMRS